MEFLLLKYEHRHFGGHPEDGEAKRGFPPDVDASWSDAWRSQGVCSSVLSCSVSCTDSLSW